MFSLFKKENRHLVADQQQRIVEAIHEAERMTSGEIRLFIESRCSYMDALDRAAEIFFDLKMDLTKERNGVLIYVAMNDHQFAVYGDAGIHQRVGDKFWNDEIGKMGEHFRNNEMVEGIRHVVLDVGEALKKHFPYDRGTDKNELPDDIVFGKD
jgi:uncharacterized membrane protein